MSPRAVLAVVNDAGSAGKTTSTVTIATIAAQRGLRVLVVDLDPQANATRWLGVDPEQKHPGAGDVLLRTATYEDAVCKTNVDGLLLLPASDALRHQRVELGRVTGGEQRLKQVLRDVDVDLVLVDCQAGAGELYPVAAMAAATGVVTVTLPGPKELEGLPRLEDMVADIAEAYNTDLKLVAIVPCAVPPANRGRIYSDSIQALGEAYGELVTPPVRHSVAAVTAYDAREPLPIHAPAAGVTVDYGAVVDYLASRGVLG